MAIVIQSLTPDTVDEALTVYRAVLGEHRRVNEEIITDRIKHGTGVFYGAFDTETGKVVGIKFGYIDGGTCVGRGIAVLPAYRRRGIGTELLRQFEHDLAARPDVRTYVFGSSSDEGVPFHLEQFSIQRKVQGIHPEPVEGCGPWFDSRAKRALTMIA